MLNLFHFRSFADGIAKKLKMVGMRADILYPNPIFPMTKMLGRLQSKGVLYAIQINQMNVQHGSFTFTVSIYKLFQPCLLTFMY